MKRCAILDDYQNCALDMADWSALAGEVEIAVFNDHLFDEDEVAARLAPYEIVSIMRERTPFPRSLFEKLPKLELLLTSGMRNRSIDVEAARDHGVTVCGTPSLGYPTAELTWGLIIALARFIPLEHHATRNGAWEKTVGVGLKDKVLGVVGLGRLGGQVATIGKAFGMEVIAWSQNLAEERCAELGVARVEKDELMSRSDVITVHLILSDRTRGLIGARDLARMKPSAFFVNTSRGPIVDETALAEILEQGRIEGAGLDVFDVEPLPADHAFLRLPNVVVTPHLGYVTRENYRGFFGGTVANIRAWLDGRPINELE